MTNFEKLNKAETYIGLQYGTSIISKEIVKYSKQYAPNSKRIPCHVLELIFRLGEWWVFEAHSDDYPEQEIPAGVRHYPLTVWLQIEHVEQFKFYQMKFDEKKLEKLIGHKYSICEIKDLMLAAINNTNGKQKDRQGDMCSEVAAKAHQGINNICDYFKLPAWCITPAHWQCFIDAHNIKEAGV